MEDLYEVSIEVLVPKTIRVKAKDENDALEKVQEMLESKNIERQRIQAMNWKFVPSGEKE